MIRKLLWLLLVILLVACSREESVTPTPQPTATTAVVLPTSTSTPIPEPTVTPEPTPIVPTLTVNEQTITDDGLLIVDEVAVPEPAWIVIHATEDGAPGAILGEIFVPAGVSTGVEVPVNLALATDMMIAMLHADTGVTGEFDFPEADEPLVGTTAVATFPVTFDIPVPVIVVTDQEIKTDGLVHIDSAYAPRSGWLIVYTDHNGMPGTPLGHTLVEPGENNDLTVQIPWREATPRLHAALHLDVGEVNMLDDLTVDIPVIFMGEPILATFDVNLPPDMIILDQPLIDGNLIVEQVISPEPRWIVVNYDEDGRPSDTIIGFAHVGAGLNEQILIDLVNTSVTPRLYLRFYEDNDPINEFDVPGVDVPLQYDGRQLDPFIVSTTPGNYLTIRDQPLTEMITVPYAVVETDGWVVVYTDSEGELGEIVGQTAVGPGINRDVEVPINPDAATPILYAVLHLDTGTIGEFEYPAGGDVPLQRNSTIISVPFSVEP